MTPIPEPQVPAGKLPKRHQRHLKALRVANANAYADHLSTVRLDIALVAGKVIICGK